MTDRLKLDDITSMMEMLSRKTRLLEELVYRAEVSMPDIYLSWHKDANKVLNMPSSVHVINEVVASLRAIASGDSAPSSIIRGEI